MNESFRMIVEDVFKIGRHTVFVGKIDGPTKTIGKCYCNLRCNGEIVLEGLEIEGEDLFRPDYMSVRTLSHVDIERACIEDGKCFLETAGH
jgi:hypothetical protein